MASLDCDFTVHVTATFPITMTGKYQTRDGRAVRILATDMRGIFSVAGIITEMDGSQHIYSWKTNGESDMDAANVVWNRNSDLIPVPTKHEGWGFYSASETAMRGPVFFTKEDALRYNGELRAFRPRDTVIAHVTWED